MMTRVVCSSRDQYRYACYTNDTISECLLKYGYWENALIQYAETYLKDDSVILDVGANIGTWSIPLALKNRTVHSFEPYDASFYALCGNIFLNHKEGVVHPHHVALIDDPAKHTTLYMEEEENRGGCKLLETSETLPHRYQLRTLDSFNLDKVDFIKLDVEGQELNVLKGGVETIKRCRPVIFFKCWAAESPHWRMIPNTHYELIAYVASLGYTVRKVDIDGDDNYEAIPQQR